MLAMPCVIRVSGIPLLCMRGGGGARRGGGIAGKGEGGLFVRPHWGVMNIPLFPLSSFLRVLSAFVREKRREGGGEKVALHLCLRL